MLYVVVTERAFRGSPECHDEYLTSIRYDRYRTGDTRTHHSTTCIEEAFRFQTLAAAEMAAVFVGGRVEEIEK